MYVFEYVQATSDRLPSVLKRRARAIDRETKESRQE